MSVKESSRLITEALTNAGVVQCGSIAFDDFMSDTFFDDRGLWLFFIGKTKIKVRLQVAKEGELYSISLGFEGRSLKMLQNLATHVEILTDYIAVTGPIVKDVISTIEDGGTVRQDGGIHRHYKKIRPMLQDIYDRLAELKDNL